MDRLWFLGGCLDGCLERSFTLSCVTIDGERRDREASLDEAVMNLLLKIKQLYNRFIHKIEHKLPIDRYETQYVY